MSKAFVPSEWVHHEHTGRLLKEWIRHRDEAMLELLSAASRSQDVEVREAHAEYTMAQRFIAQLKGGDMQRSDDVPERDAAAEAED